MKKYIITPILFLMIWLLAFSVSAQEDSESCYLGLGESYKISSLAEIGSELDYSKDIISIDENGIVTAKAIGEACISHGGQMLYTVTVMNAPETVSLNKKKLTLGVGEIFDFDAVFSEGTYSKMKEYTCDSDILAYKGSGTFTALKEGTANVTLTTFNGKTALCKITVKAAPEKITLEEKKVTLGVGETYTFYPEVSEGSASNKITYSLSNKSVIKKKKNGTYIAKKTGKVTVTLKTYNGKKVKCRITVKKMPSQIYTASSYYTMTIGSTRKIDVSMPKNTYCGTFKYKSSDSSVVSVSKSGKMTAKKNGTARITVTSLNKKKTSFTVTVKSMSVPFVSQFPEYPTGCEAACSTSLLRYYGYDISLDKMVNIIPSRKIKIINGKRVGPDINECFVGDPRGSYTSDVPGYGIFSPGVAKALNKAIKKLGGNHTAEKIENCTWKKLLDEVSSGNPVIVWSTYEMINPKGVNSWYIPQEDGSYRYFEYPRGTHVTVLIGHSDSYVTLLDPIKGVVSYKKRIFKKRWKLLGNQAVVIRESEH